MDMIGWRLFMKVAYDGVPGKWDRFMARPIKGWGKGC